jgi:hypothetical protein
LLIRLFNSSSFSMALRPVFGPRPSRWSLKLVCIIKHHALTMHLCAWITICHTNASGNWRMTQRLIRDSGHFVLWLWRNRPPLFIGYSSDSQPGVRIPPGVRTRTFRGTQKKLNYNGKKAIIGLYNIQIWNNSSYINYKHFANMKGTIYVHRSVHPNYIYIYDSKY